MRRRFGNGLLLAGILAIIFVLLLAITHPAPKKPLTPAVPSASPLPAAAVSPTASPSPSPVAPSVIVEQVPVQVPAPTVITPPRTITKYVPAPAAPLAPAPAPVQAPATGTSKKHGNIRAPPRDHAPGPQETIGGFSGIPVCVSCGTEVLPNQSQWVVPARSQREKLIALLKTQYGVPNDATIFERLADLILDAGWRHVEG